jgi:hypothetical protein
MLVIRGRTMKRHFVLISIITLLFSGNIIAKEFPYLYKGARPLGMGGAFVAVSDDANALFYNPAGLADIKESRISPVDLEIELGRGAYDFYNDALDVNTDNDQEVAEFLQKYIGEYGHFATSLFPNYTSPNFACGLIGSIKSNLQARDKQYPKLVVDAIEDLGICAGYAWPFLEDSLIVGSNLKYLYRKSNENEYSVADITTDDFNHRFKDGFKDGSGILLDLGVMYKFKDFTMNGKNVGLQAGLSANNLIGNGLGNAADLDPHVDIGVSSRFDAFTLALDYVDLFGQLGDDNDVGKRIRLGIEYVPVKMLTLRTGIYQGYPTLGASIGTQVMQFDMLTYAEEVGTYSGQRDDRRFLLRMAFGF